MDPLDIERVVVIGLGRRPERLRRFWRDLPQPWPFRQPSHVLAIDGERVPMPGWYAPSRPQDRGRLHRPRIRGAENLSGAWGCLRSHHRVWEETLNLGLDSVLVFEDDAVFCRAFDVALLAFLDAVPSDWHQVYLGGQHLGDGPLLPIRVNEHVLRGRNVNRTHAYVMRRPMLDEICRRMLEPWGSVKGFMFHVDHQLGQLHRDGEWNVYCPSKWLVGQAEDVSDVKMGTPHHEHWWNDFRCREPSEQEAAATVPA